MLQKYVPFPPGNQAGIFIRDTLSRNKDADKTADAPLLFACNKAGFLVTRYI